MKESRFAFPPAAVTLAVLSALLLSCSSEPTKSFQVLGNAMEPNFHDRQVVQVEAVSMDDLKRGDVIVFEIGQKTYLKRIVALPGETLELHEGQVLIDGTPIEEPYETVSGRLRFGPVALGQDELFVLGDNRPNSQDSRGFGPISGASVIGRVTP